MKGYEDEWESVILRIRREIFDTLKSNSDGVAIVSIHIVASGDGKPILWVVPDGKRVEPSRDAKDVLIAALTG